ncbi:rod-binding protein [Parasphingorhabdus cellanae]|uniref:Rod-binding protein n=1 Tax=Parasphingorhabdus cellanae TaxID=2806553 RepID=A0ABX7T1I6_9SPHN|nr:rod-binding protein [Parasphingorhabdus cellanae]QTD55433.1 rod-binding protein [Parasphingorhabdus cellanae]
MNITHNTGGIAPQSLANPVSDAANGSKTPLETMAADFEAIFVRQMLSTMRASSLGEGLFDGQGTEEFRDMQDSMLAKDMADKGVFGVAELLSRHVQNSSGGEE